ncbi:MAG: RNA 2',3'-cyclic phosphodiesterase [Gallionellaceae bacterium]|jgi:2'-5' RNA ligase
MKKIDTDRSLRLFFALWPTKATRTALAAWQPRLREQCGGKEMRADTLHSTLVFLGEVAAHRLEALLLAAQEVTGSAFEIEFNVARYWGHNHIAYAAPQIVPIELTELVHTLEQHLRKHHFHFEPREFKPHVTLLRHTQWSDAPLPQMNTVRWPAHEFVLVQSLSDEQGPRYEVLARFALRD